MKYKDNLIDKSTIILIITALIIGALILVLLFWNKKLDNKNEEGSKSSEVKQNKKVNIEMAKKAKSRDAAPNICFFAHFAVS